MSTDGRFGYVRPDLQESLARGDSKIVELMKGSAHAVRRDALLIAARSDHPYVYRLVEGWACRTRRLSDGREQCILIFLPGDLFAVKSMFVVQHPDAVCTLSAVVLERIAYPQLHAAYLRDGDIANRCLWQVMEEERRLHSWVVGLGQGSAEERIALLLIDFRGRLATAGIIAENALTFAMPLTQSRLADHLGITAIHVNRVLKVFRDRGIATVRDGSVTITDLDELRRAALPLLDPFEEAAPSYAGRSSLLSEVTRR